MHRTAPALTRASTVEELEPGHQAEEWQVTAELHTPTLMWADDSESPWLLVAVDPRRKVFERKGDYDLRRITEVVLRTHCGGLQTAVVRFLRGSEVVVTSEVRDVPFSMAPSEMVFDLPRPAPAQPLCDRLELVFEGAEPRVGLIDVVLISRPPSAYVREDGASEFEIESGRGRTARWISVEQGLEADVRIGSDSDFSFGYCVPARARSADPGAQVAVTVEGRSGERIERVFPLETAPGELIWRDQRFELDDLAGEEATVRVEVRADGDAACLIADAWLIEESAPIPPSILLITSDTHRADHVGALSPGKSVSTPVLDALAARGVLFSDCWSSTNTTNPSHIAMMTGLPAVEIGIVDQVTPVSEQAVTLAEVLRERGYSTWAAISARHLGPETSGLGQGFDRLSWPPQAWERRVDETLADVERWLSTADDKPVFLWLHVFDPHFPYVPPAPEGSSSEASPGVAGASDVPDGLPPQQRENAHFHGIDDLDVLRRRYREEISYLDSRLREVTELPRFRDGVIAMVADHGESLGHNNVLFDHAELNAGTLHVPLILAWPSAPKGTRVAAPVTNVDLARTLISLAGFPEVEFPGQDLRSVIGRPVKPVPRFAVAAHWTEASVTLGSDHLILHLSDHFEEALYAPRTKHSVELYDLANDPECARNLAERDVEKAKRLREAVIQWLGRRGAGELKGSRSESVELIRGLQELGYSTAPPDPTSDVWEEDDCESCRKFR